MLTEDMLFGYLQENEKLNTSSMDENNRLFSSGILDSFAMVSLVTFVEKNTGFRVKATDLTLENFDCVNFILKYVDRQTS